MQIIKDYVKEQKAYLKEQIGDFKKHICVYIIQVGHNPASDRYVSNKIKDLEEVGIEAKLLRYSKKITEGYLVCRCRQLNEDSSVTGYIVQMPLPPHINPEKIRQVIDPSKDVDGFHPMTKISPATPLGIVTYLKRQNFHFEGENAVVIGRSDIVGKPMARLLLKENMNVTVIHSHTRVSDKICFLSQAKLVVVATGHPHTICSDWFYDGGVAPMRDDAVLFDVGINFDENGKMVGDCDPDLPIEFQSLVPGGVGLLTRLAVIENVLKLAIAKERE